MKNVITLSNHIFVWLWKSIFAQMAVASVILQMILLWVRIGVSSGLNQNDAFLPYERILYESGVTKLILFGFFFMFAVILFQGVNLRRNHKPIYTLLTLPMPREQVYSAFLLSGLAWTAAFLAFHAVLLILWYVPVTSVVNAHSMEVILNLDNGQKFTGMNNNIHNGLFLAFLRDPILHTLYPSTIEGLCTIVAIVLVALSQCFVSIFAIKEKKLSISSIIFNAFWYYWMISILTRFFTGLDKISDLDVWVRTSLYIILITVVAITHIKRGEGGNSK